MSYKFDSLVIILNKLDGGEAVTVHSLMNDLEISERTVHRYVKTLQVAGFPIGFDRARGIYAFDAGYSLRKPDLTLEEMLSLALARKVLGSYGAGIDKGLAGIEDKLTKNKGGLPSHIVLANETAAHGQEYLGIIHQAISNFQKIEIEYKALYADEQALRTVDPYSRKASGISGDTVT